MGDYRKRVTITYKFIETKTYGFIVQKTRKTWGYRRQIKSNDIDREG